MTALNTLKLAMKLCQATRTPFVVVDAYNSGGSQRWGQCFPSMTQDQLDACGEPFAVPCVMSGSAIDLFTTLARDEGENNDGCMIGGTITLVTLDAATGAAETRTHEIGNRDRPVYENGVWRSEPVLERL